MTMTATLPWYLTPLALLLAPMFGGLLRHLTGRMAGVHGPPVRQRYGHLIGLSLQRATPIADGPAWGAFAAPIAFAATFAAMFSIPACLSAAPEHAIEGCLVLVGLLASARAVVTLNALGSRSTRAVRAATSDLGRAAAVYAAIACALLCTIGQLALLDPSPVVALPRALAAGALAVAAWLETGRGDGSAAALLDGMTGRHRALAEMAADLRAVILWSLWLLLFVPVPELSAAPIPIGALLGAGLVVVVSILAAAEARLARPAMWRTQALPMVALALAAMSLLILIAVIGFEAR